MGLVNFPDLAYLCKKTLDKLIGAKLLLGRTSSLALAINPSALDVGTIFYWPLCSMLHDFMLCAGMIP